MKRRHLLRLLACGGAGAPPLHAEKPPVRVGVLAPSTAAREAVTLKPFFDEMARLGWVEGGTVQYERHYADDQYQALPRLARELVARQPQLIFAPPLSSAIAARQATRTIPIVFATGTDPVGVGLVDSLSRPGGNATGMISVIDSLAPKALELLLQLMPGVKRIGLLGDPGDPRLQLDRTALAPLMAARGLSLSVFEAATPAALDTSLTRALAARMDVVMTNSSMAFNLRHQLIPRLHGDRVAVVAHRSEMADAGALFSYGALLADQIRRAASVADRILRGARPADIPVEQPTAFELTLNLKTARALGVQVPHALRVRADRVIE